MFEASSPFTSRRTSIHQDSLPLPTNANGNDSLLVLVGSDLACMQNTTSMLNKVGYRVTTVTDLKDLFPLKKGSAMAYALLSESLGALDLESAARFIRAEWPIARILFLGSSQRMLEDHLYDERIDASCRPQELLKVLSILDRHKPGGRPFVVPSSVSSNTVEQGNSPKLAPGQELCSLKIFTIGFTKKSAETFFTLLRNAGVKRLVDVRLNNVSQLSGFAKKDDLRFLAKCICDIEYIHLDSLAPTKSMLKDYKKPNGDWQLYEERFTTLMQTRRIEEMISPELMDGSCLLCSEEKPHHCHRRLVAEYLRNRWGRTELEIEHLA